MPDQLLPVAKGPGGHAGGGQSEFTREPSAVTTASPLAGLSVRLPCAPHATKVPSMRPASWHVGQDLGNITVGHPPSVLLATPRGEWKPSLLILKGYGYRHLK